MTTTTGERTTKESPFRLHTEESLAPGNRRLFLLVFWAAACVFVGLIPAARLVVALVTHQGPWWYPWTAFGLGILGIGLIAGAIAAIHRKVLWWLLLGVATLMLAANVALVYTVF